ncbi:hypothetical protein SESBI_32613 [Sesbania bispinosa]|nr:hypothetical protein SESBI_32613 [Sesbania bispinosa]
MGSDSFHISFDACVETGLVIVVNGGAADFVSVKLASTSFSIFPLLLLRNAVFVWVFGLASASSLLLLPPRSTARNEKAMRLELQKEWKEKWTSLYISF